MIGDMPVKHLIILLYVIEIMVVKQAIKCVFYVIAIMSIKHAMILYVIEIMVVKHAPRLKRNKKYNCRKA